MTARTADLRTRALNARPKRAGLLNRIATAHAVWRERRQLARLDAAGLDDIGRSAEEARREAERPLWDVPDRWLR